MSEALMNAAGSGEFHEKMATELLQLTSAFDDVTNRWRFHNEKLSSAQESTDTLLSDVQHVQTSDTLLSDVQHVQATVDEMMSRISSLNFTTTNPDIVAKLHAELKVKFWTVCVFLGCLSGLQSSCPQVNCGRAQI